MAAQSQRRQTEDVRPAPATRAAIGQGHEDEILDHQPEQIADRAAEVGAERLDRSAGDILITGFIGGVEVSIGALAAMVVLGSATAAFPSLHLYGGLALAGLVFPLGFLFVILGRSELFTENFLIPVASVLRGEERFTSLLVLWLGSIVGNLLGCGAIAALVSIPHAVGEPILSGYDQYSAYKLALPWYGILGSAILAGLIMTVLTWLMVAIRHPVGKIAAIFAAGYALFATNVSHVVVTAAILFVSYLRLGDSLSHVLWWLGIATGGNLIGGVGFVTFFRFAQVREKKRHTEAGAGTKP